MSVAVHSRGYRRRRRPELDIPPQIHIRGGLLEYRNGKAWEPPPAAQKRSEITQFTSAARLRLIKSLLAIDYRNMPLSVAITLTYPDERLPRDMDQRGMDRSQMIRNIEKHLGREVYGLWRTEWLPRKSGDAMGILAPHIHLVLFRVRFIPYQTINEWWQGCIQWPHYVRTEIRRARKQRTTLHYLAKYISKKPDSSLVYASYPNKPDGKHYDWIRRGMVPTYPHEWISDVTLEQAEHAYAAHKRAWPESEVRPGESFSVMGNVAVNTGKILRQMVLTTDRATK